MRSLGAVAVFVLLQQAAPVRAADPPPPPLWSGEGTLSYVQTGGNSESLTIGSSLRALYQSAPWKAELRAAFIRTKTEDLVSAQKFTAQLRGERAFNASVSAYGQASFLRDRFAGIDSQSILEAGGLYKLSSGPQHFASVSAGLGFTDEKREPPDADRSFAAGRLAVSYHYKINATAELGEDADALADLGDFGDWRANNTLSLSASISRILALRIAHQIAYIHQPVAGKKSTDTTFLASIVAKWPAPAAKGPCP